MNKQIVGVMVQDVELVIKRSANLPFTMLDKLLMVMGEFYIGLIPALIPPFIRVMLVYHLNL